jgi:hypothetical protein
MAPGKRLRRSIPADPANDVAVSAGFQHPINRRPADLQGFRDLRGSLPSAFIARTWVASIGAGRPCLARRPRIAIGKTPFGSNPAGETPGAALAEGLGTDLAGRGVPNHPAGRLVAGPSHLPWFAIAKAWLSNVSSAIFWANMQSPAAKFPMGRKHHLQIVLPAESSWSMFIIWPCRMR